MEDSDAWLKYPQYRKWFDKLYLSDTLGYYCGPSGLPPDRSDYFIVRPVYNLSGMSAGARIQFIEAGDASIVEPGYFWCEIFNGPHISVTYDLNKNPISAWTAKYHEHKPLRISKWTRTFNYPKLPSIFSDIRTDTINAEFIGNNLIEIHFRGSPDPEYDELIPIWSDMIYDTDRFKHHKFIEAVDNANGFLSAYRKGFYVK